jgi:hypothetical protein
MFGVNGHYTAKLYVVSKACDIGLISLWDVSLDIVHCLEQKHMQYFRVWLCLCLHVDVECSYCVGPVRESVKK